VRPLVLPAIPNVVRVSGSRQSTVPNPLPGCVLGATVCSVFTGSEYVASTAVTTSFVLSCTSSNTLRE